MTVPHLDWPALHALLEAGDVPAVAAAFHGQNQGAREELEQYVTAYWDALQRVPVNSTSPSPWENRAAATQVAGVASAAAPGSAASWIGKNFPRPDDEVLSVLRGRDPQWLAELLHRLMERLERPRRLPEKLQADWSLVTRLAAQAGLALPSEDALAAGVYARSRSYLPRMREHPDLIAYAQEYFNGSGAYELGTAEAQTAVAELVGEGAVDIGPLIDGCLRRLLAGGTPPALAPFLGFYQRLAPQPAELAARTRALLALLPSGSVAVAALAQGELRRADDAGLLDEDVLLQASQSTLLRSEKKVVKGQLSWLDATARRHPARCGQILRTAAMVFTHQAGDLQTAALSLIVRHAAKAAPADRAAVLAEAVAALPADLARRAADCLGADEEKETEPQPMVYPAPADVPAPVLAVLPPPIGSPAELAEEYVALLEHEPADAITVERVLAAFVAFAHADREALRAACAPVISREPSHRWGEPALLKEIAQASTGPAPARCAPQRMASAIAASLPEDQRSCSSAWDFGGYRNRYTGDPGVVLLHRMAEIAAGLRFAPVAGLLSTPTSVTGAIDPSVLLDRLEAVAKRAADTGADAGTVWAYDLEQALLRVPLPVHPVLVERARAIDSAAGRQAAAWFAAGGGELPRVERLVRYLPGQNGKGEYNGDYVRLTVELVPTVPARDAPADSGDDLGESAEPLALTSLLGIGRPACHQSHWLRCWPAVLPAHRDLIAGFALAAIHSPAIMLLPELAAADGQLSGGFGVLLANGLTSQNAADRVAAVDAAMVLIGRGQLDAVGLAQDLAALSTGKETVLARAVPALREIAEAGGAREVRDVIAAMLPAALPPTAPKVPRGMADLLALMADIAEPAGTHTEIPQITALAQKGGSASVQRAARRLHALLSGSSG